MDEWQEVALDEVATLNGGFAFKSSQYTESGRFVLRTVNITDDFAITKDGATFISEREAADYKRFLLQEHDTLFVMVAATLGKVGYVRSKDLPALLNQNMWVIRARTNKIDPVFLHYAFREISKVPLSWVGGSARSFLRRDDVRTLRFKLPPAAEQQAIANVLAALDDKIELNRRINETLEGIAQAVFRDWFVDFGPVRRAQAGVTDPVAMMGGLIPDPARAAHLAALFPAVFGHDGLPVGWKAGTLGDIAKAVGETVSPKSLRPDTPYFGLEHLPRCSITLHDWGHASAVNSNKAKFEPGQVLFGKLRPYFHKVGLAPLDGVCSTDIVVMDGIRTVDRPFVVSCASSKSFVDYTDQGSTGTKMPRTSWGQMKKYPLAISTALVRDAYSEIVQPMHDKIIAAVHENRTLAETRNYLLPRLISGAVRVAPLAEAA